MYCRGPGPPGRPAPDAAPRRGAWSQAWRGRLLRRLHATRHPTVPGHGASAVPSDRDLNVSDPNGACSESVCARLRADWRAAPGHPTVPRQGIRCPARFRINLERFPPLRETEAWTGSGARASCVRPAPSSTRWPGRKRPRSPSQLEAGLAEPPCAMQARTGSESRLKSQCKLRGWPQPRHTRRRRDAYDADIYMIAPPARRPWLAWRGGKSGPRLP
jgi:hypothetical protein